MESYTGNIMTLSNSIIGVSILAMPFCFKQCGVLLSILILILSSIVTRLTSHFLLKSAIMSRRRTFELLAFHAFGPTGKFMVELGIIGFMMGTCIAFFVIIGDLGPAIIAKMMGNKPTDTLRTSILIGVALFCVLPLGLLKNVDSLHSVSTATIGFYFCLVLKTFSESATYFVTGNWLENVEMWRPIGILQCLPIFSMALSCQTQLFEIYETVSNPTLEKMNYIVRIAINICVAVYICVGFFGYAAFAAEPFTGNILMSFSQSPVTDAMKIGFVLSVAFSFPLVIFPCRASLYSLLFKKGYQPYEGASNYIPESKFKFLTVIIIITSLTIGILIPNIEVVLGLLGSTIGIMICMIFPVTCFICISTKNTNERLVAQFLLFIGVIVMVMGTYANLYAMEQINEPIIIDKSANLELINDFKHNMENDVLKIVPILNKEKIEGPPIKESKKKLLNQMKNQLEEIRLEPPQPVEPQDVPVPEQVPKKKSKIKEVNRDIPDNTIKKDTNKSKFDGEVHEVNLENKENIVSAKTVTKKADEVDIEAIKKEDKELQEDENTKRDNNKEVDLIKTIEQYKEEQKKLIEEQKELIEERKQAIEKFKEKQKIDNEVEQEERRKAASQIIEIAKKAIEQLAPVDVKHKNEKNKLNIDNEIKVDDKIDNFVTEKPIKKLETRNVLPNNRLLPIPMAGNKTFNEILYDQNQSNNMLKPVEQKENVQQNTLLETKLTENKPLLINNVETKTNNENNQIDPIKIISKPVENIPKIDNKNPKYAEAPKFDQVPEIDHKVPEIDHKVPEINQVPENDHKVPENDHKILETNSNDNFNPAKRDILTKEEITEKILRLKREITDKNQINNEECEITEANILVKTESPLLKLITEMTKTELKIDFNLIDSMKTQLQSETIHIKRK